MNFLPLLTLLLAVSTPASQREPFALAIHSATPTAEIVSSIVDAIERNRENSKLENEIEAKISQTRPRRMDIGQRSYGEAMKNFLHMLETTDQDMSRLQRTRLVFSDTHEPSLVFDRSGSQIFFPANAAKEDIEGLVLGVFEQLRSIEMWEERSGQKLALDGYGHTGSLRHGGDPIDAVTYLAVLKELWERAGIGNGILRRAHRIIFSANATTASVSRYGDRTNLYIPPKVPEENIMALFSSALNASASVETLKAALEQRLRSHHGYRGSAIQEGLYHWGSDARLARNLAMALAQLETSALDLRVDHVIISDNGATRADRLYGEILLIINHEASAATLVEDITGALERMDAIAALEERIRQKTDGRLKPKYNVQDVHADSNAYEEALERLERVASQVETTDTVVLAYAFGEQEAPRYEWSADLGSHYTIPIAVGTPEDSLVSSISIAIERTRFRIDAEGDIIDAFIKHGAYIGGSIYNEIPLDDAYTAFLTTLAGELASVDKIPGLDHAIALLIFEDESEVQAFQSVDAFRIYY